MIGHKELENFFEKFPLSKDELLDFSKKLGFSGLTNDSAVEVLKACGMPLETGDENILLTTSKNNLKDTVFCFVDIETNGSNPRNSQVIEIGAVRYQNGKFLDSFETLIYAERLPQNIADITQLTLDDLKEAKSEKQALKEFRAFLKDAVFCAHSVDFDFSFLSFRMDKHGIGPLLNRKLCTLDLAKKTLKASKYGLKTLKEELGLGDEVHHRALPDAKSSALVFEASLKNMEQYPICVNELITYIKTKEQVKQQDEESEADV